MPGPADVGAPYVAVIGPGEGATEEERATAMAVGRLLAARGVVTVNGGLGGVMEASAEGAAAIGGVVLGLLPGSHRAEGNGYLTFSLPTGLGELRNGLVVRSADGIVAVGCSWGTLAEIALAVRAGVPLVCLGGWSMTDAAGVDIPLQRAPTPEAAVTRVLELIQAWPGGTSPVL